MFIKSPFNKQKYIKIISVGLSVFTCIFLAGVSNIAYASETSGLEQEIIPVKNTCQNIIQNRTVTQTIYYQYEDGSQAAPTYRASLNFQRVDIQKKDNDVIVNPGGQWVPQRQNFASVISPEIAGYTPSQTSVSQNNVDPSDQNYVTTVIYHKLHAKTITENVPQQINQTQTKNQNIKINSTVKTQTALPVVVHDVVKSKLVTTSGKTSSQPASYTSSKVLPETGENKMTMVTYLGFMLVLIATFLETYLVTEKN